MSPEVLNKRDVKGSPVDAVYVGRPSKWGNPFPVMSTGRERCIDAFRFWFYNSPESPIGDIEELRGKDLICWCAPLPCHADILLEEANK